MPTLHWTTLQKLFKTNTSHPLTSKGQKPEFFKDWNSCGGVTIYKITINAKMWKRLPLICSFTSLHPMTETKWDQPNSSKTLNDFLPAVEFCQWPWMLIKLLGVRFEENVLTVVRKRTIKDHESIVNLKTTARQCWCCCIVILSATFNWFIGIVFVVFLGCSIGDKAKWRQISRLLDKVYLGLGWK